jgi:hypothetical protein
MKHLVRPFLKKPGAWAVVGLLLLNEVRGLIVVSMVVATWWNLFRHH